MTIGTRVGSGGPYEDRYGYSRVVRVGPLAMTAGTTAVVDGRVRHPGDPAGQARTAFETALAALAQAGIDPAHVVSTRMYITDAAHTDLVGAVHGEVFGEIRPVATMVVVAGLVDPAMLVEIELVAWAADA